MTWFNFKFGLVWKLVHVLLFFYFPSILFEKTFKNCMNLKMKHIYVLFYKEIMKILYIYMYFLWQQYLDLFCTVNFFFQDIVSFYILHVCYACILLTFYILHTHIKGRENLRLFVQHDIALKVPFSFLFIKIIFAMIFSLIYSLSCIENITGSVSLRSVIIFATHEKLGSSPLLRLLPFTAGLQIYVIWLDYFVICPWFL